MKADVALPGPQRPLQPASLLLLTVAFIARIPQRLRDRRFWQIQAMVIVVTLLHFAIEVVGYTSPASILHDVVLTLYVVPILYAALTFGWEGAIMTALLGIAITSSSTWVWHHERDQWLTEILQIVVSFSVGMLVAWRVDREARERLRAEQTSASLKLLNTVGKRLTHTLELEQQLPQIARLLRAGLGLGSISLRVEGERGNEPLIVYDGEPVPPDGPLGPRSASVPLVGEGSGLGLLTATSGGGQPPSEEQVEVLATASQEISVALENARLYRQREENLQAYIRQVTQAQEDERLRIARELHDDTAQALVHLVRQLERCDSDVGPSSRAVIEESLATARGVLQSVRRFSRDLRPSVLDDLGLLAALEMIVADNNTRLAGGAHLDITGEPHRLEPSVELALFRIAQEALRNVEKHARASMATVELAFGTRDTRLTISDDGVGFSLPANLADLVRTGKLGVIGMKERAESVGGCFELQPTPPRGVRLAVVVPAQ